MAWSPKITDRNAKLTEKETASLRDQAGLVADMMDMQFQVNEVPVPIQVAGVICWLATTAMNNAATKEELIDRLKTITGGIEAAANAGWDDPDYWKERRQQEAEQAGTGSGNH